MPLILFSKILNEVSSIFFEPYRHGKIIFLRFCSMDTPWPSPPSRTIWIYFVGLGDRDGLESQICSHTYNFLQATLLPRFINLMKHFLLQFFIKILGIGLICWLKKVCPFFLETVLAIFLEWFFLFDRLTRGTGSVSSGAIMQKGRIFSIFTFTLVRLVKLAILIHLGSNRPVPVCAGAKQLILRSQSERIYFPPI